MTYNKARAEREWIRWKEAEEKNLRDLGVDEDIIQRLHMYDWEEFKSNRRFYERWSNTDTYIDDFCMFEQQKELQTVEELLDSIEDQRVYQILKKTDKKTLQIVLWRLNGYSSAEISIRLGISVNAVNLRMWKLLKKLRNFL